MKQLALGISCCISICVLTCGCQKSPRGDEQVATDPITIASPAPSVLLSSLSLNESQKDYVRSGNEFAFKCLRTIYDEMGRGNILISPLSLQYALAMAANGASGVTLNEIMEMLGYSCDFQELNAFMNVLLNQLPALDDNVELKVTDAMLVHEDFRLQEALLQTLNNEYYAPVEYVNLSDKEQTVERINEWAGRNTNGFIDPFIGKGEIPDNLVFAILNALYFKAKWADVGGTMFNPESTMNSQPFYCIDGSQTKVDYMKTTRYLKYARRDGYQAAELPYANGIFAMYILLPDSKDGKDMEQLLGSLSDGEWNELESALEIGSEVHLSLPEFEIEQKYKLREMLEKLGMNRSFLPEVAEFDLMFRDSDIEGIYLSDVIQKSRIKVTEWGTEAASVTVEMGVGAAGPPDEAKEVYFTADHPFVFVIAEKTSGVVLFEGIFAGAQ